MKIHITTRAQDAMINHTPPQGYGLRITGKLAGGCGCTLDYHLSLDQKREGDLTFHTENLQVWIDEFTTQFLEDSLTLDYIPAQGFRLSSPSEIYAYGLSIAQPTF